MNLSEFLCFPLVNALWLRVPELSSSTQSNTMWQLTSKGENSSSLLSPTCPVFTACTFLTQSAMDFLTHQVLPLWKVTFTFAIFASCFHYGFTEQKGKEPNVSVYLVPPIPLWEGLTERGLRPRGLGWGCWWPGPVPQKFMLALRWCPGSLMEWGQIFSSARAMPFQPVVD